MLSALIMAGGKGTRFWPLSTEDKPKQFLSLIGEDTMIQMTVERIKPIIPVERIFICTGEKYVSLVKEQLPEIPLENIIVEPEGRNTAPCIALSALIMKRRFNNATMLVLPSDHLIKKEEKFREIILKGNDYLEKNRDSIITLGIEPNRPETGYGYIKFKKENGNNDIIKVEKFVEKPNLELAKEYILDGSYLWNGGMFLWDVNNIIMQIKKYAPTIYNALKDIEYIDEKLLQQTINENYKNTESISIDYAVLEKSNHIFVIPSDISWDDIGTWQSVERYKEKDCHNNILTKDVKVIKSKSNIAINNNKKIVMIGIEDTMTLETEDTIFIVNKNYMDKLRDYREIL
ncbi:mannose-1-phosphate guanylyltransferase [Clostridium perfringens]|uniref:mannose-1-phosphate guanylyltransferase n=1 Tax=Clostridium perfringens TaxID=1502 RepID=UPI00224596F8|nr:mannose-1-phosphate guanylyltransferase [Clostridium perfringens]MCX0371529.1 mannose-1-phosphate guanylyltransferase [Clostridium perfringens]MDN4737044.1 mannose-1-phosphate guanylyltransferase [Clostridium perfringens]MDN4740549.1 mannose-1-phosphate guanylyltransferase [Clostridium perfringens]